MTTEKNNQTEHLESAENESMNTCHDEAMLAHENTTANSHVQTNTHKNAEELGEEKNNIQTEYHGGKTKNKKKRGFFFTLFKTLGIIFAALFILLTGLVIFSLINRTDPVAHFPEKFTSYVSIPSIGSFTQKVLHLKAIDVFLQDKNNASLRGTVRSLRSNPFFRSKSFLRLANIRLDVARYADGSMLGIADIGIRSVLTPFLPLIRKLYPDLENPIEEMQWQNDGKHSYWEYTLSQTEKLYIGLHKNLIIAANSYELFDSAFVQVQNKEIRRLAKTLHTGSDTTLRFLTDANHLIEKLGEQNTYIAGLKKEMTFPAVSVADLSIEDESINVSVHTSWKSDNQNVQALLQRKSHIPAILAKLPSSVAYYSLLNLGEPQFLWNNFEPFLEKDIIAAYKKADKAARFAFGQNIEQLLFSWMGDELGVFACENVRAPVFFIAVKDEKACKQSLERIYKSILVNQDISAVVDGVRIPRIVFPAWLSGLLRLFKIELVQPFYLIKDGFIYLSTSAEALRLTQRESDEGKLLVKTQKWKEILNTTPETSTLIYYTLERSIPFFLKGSDSLQSVLKMYGRGIASLTFSADNTITLELSARQSDAKSLTEIVGFPITLPTSPDSPLIIGRDAQNTPRALWASGKNICNMNLSNALLDTLPLDGTAGISAVMKGEKITSLWASSAAGSVYKLNQNLHPAAPFPLMTGEKFAAAPAAFDDMLIVPLQKEAELLFIHETGEILRSQPMHSKMKASPVCFENYIAAIPRSFESSIYLFDKQGNIIDGWPIPAAAITAVQPLVIRNNKNKAMLFIVTEDGQVRLTPLDQTDTAGFELTVNAVCKIPPVYSKTHRCFYLISNEGFLWKIDESGSIQDSIPLKGGIADDYCMTLLDLNQDGKEEVLVSGGGNALYAYFGDFAPVQGFPVEGTGNAGLIDIDGDGIKELITVGMDKRLHAYLSNFQ
ncbi:FG-GAP repeat domain-containing protein [Treponema phagedenis]|uniref:FG-GAP repeat domain-containing protein n=1 Tax=Treponema phagedenis TaxID=162 RepID=UPI001583D5CA|nr:VCBS repeat-containing protein [Treponema phagedenis]NVP23086.1 VCBS repeat-containing protein [Treponema phagedenis]QKS92288.1 VCBS repeat-containing protein [Treponema phagedenis]QLC57956.1 VCBS repeat-containing protein [Treponema phagedenis]